MPAVKIPAIMSWSGGKDSAYALYKIREEGLYDVRYLFTTIDGSSRKMAIHEVPEMLLDQQAKLVGIPLIKCYLFHTTNDAYEAALQNTLEPLQQEGIHHIIFGDLFLEDLRLYRESLMLRLGMVCVFPLWQMDSRTLVTDFILNGFRSMICTVNESYLPPDWVGNMIDEQFLKSLPLNVDPCGENGEYHSFCFDGPIFEHALNFTVGNTFRKSFDLNTSSQESDRPAKLTMWHIEIFPAPAIRPLSCARCQKSFECNSSDISNCHCNDVGLSKAVQDFIKSRYDDCLCNNCLRELAAGQKAISED